jgi:hypothetical protein
MRKFFNWLSIAGAITALVVLGWLHFSTVSESVVNVSGTSVTEPFGTFPIDQPRLVTYDVEEIADTLTERQQRDQVLDWLLFAILSDAGLTVERLNEITFDLPASRHGYLRPIANFEYGVTRSRFIGDGKVVALIPADLTADKRADYLAQVFDEHRKDLGETPALMLVFEYAVDLSEQSASITRGREIDGKSLLTAQYGYIESEIRSVDELGRFVAATNDITMASVQANVLVLGGRKMKSRNYRSVGVEDIAALWQSEQKLQTQLSAFEQRWQAEIDQFNATWRSRTYRTESERNELNRQFAQEDEALTRRMLTDRKKLGLVEHSGFSLDPTYDYEGLAIFFGEMEKLLRSGIGPDSAVRLQDITAAHEGIRNRNEVPLLILLDKIKKTGNLGQRMIGELVEANSRKFRFQAARYDGELRGTEVGMTLFYTDLLAKLWALDLIESAPTREIEDFRPLTKVSVSPVYKQEMKELPSTRLWFGHQDKGFQVTEDAQAVLLSRNATRIYAASSNPLQPGRETEPSAASEAFLGWWNDHYDDVARYEAEYERLNQIMKWSVILGWMNAANKGQLLGFLMSISVNQTQWFPEWVRKHPALRFREWDHVNFQPRAYKGSNTEAMPILKSKSYKQLGGVYTLSGGVSLAPKQLFKERKALSTATDPLLRRSNLDYAAVENAGKAFRTHGGAGYRLVAGDRGRTTLIAIAKEGAKLRSRVGDISSGGFERTMFREGTNLAIETTSGGKPIGKLQIARQANGFNIGWRGREIDAGQALGRRVSRNGNIAEALLSDRDVEIMLQLPGNNRFAVKLRGSESWLKLAPEEQPSTTLAKGWEARVSDPDDGVRNIQLAWVKDAKEFLPEFADDGVLVIGGNIDRAKKIVRYEPARAPPPNAKTVTFEIDDANFRGWVEPDTGTVRMPWKVVKDAGKDNPMALAGRIATADVNAARSAPTGNITVRVARGMGDPPIVRSLRGNDFPGVARAIANDSKRAASEINQSLIEGLRDSQKLLAERQFVKAVEHLDDLIAIYGPVPELLLHKGMAQLARGKTQNASEALQQVSPRISLRDRKAFQDEIVARRNTSHNPVERDNLGRLADYAEWQDLQSRKIVPPARVVPAVNGKRLDLHYHSSNPLDGDLIIAAELASVRPTNAAIYVQDRPGLNNLDWSVSLYESLRQLPSGELPVMTKLNNVPITYFRPDVIYSPDGVTKFKLVNKRAPVRQIRASYGGAPSRCQDTQDPECTEEHRPQSVVLVMIKR